MKKFLTFAFILAASYYMVATTGSDEPKSTKSDNVPMISRTVVYSEADKALVYEDSVGTDFSNIVFKSLPPLSEEMIPVSIVLTKGNYTLTKSPELEIPLDYRIYLEDTWTLKNYNLNSSEHYSFKVKSTDPERFILHIEKPVTGGIGRG
jgi:hypothetical protein